MATRTVRGACPHDCPDTCAMHVTVEDGRAVKVGGDPDHPITVGFLCGKVSNYLDRVYEYHRRLPRALTARTEARWVVGFEVVLGALLAPVDGGVSTSIPAVGE